MSELASRRVWKVLVWGAALAFFATRDEAEKCAAEKVSQGWDSKSIVVVEVDLPLSPPPPTTEPLSDREEFLQWLEKRMQSVGYTVETAPNYLKDAYISGKPSDLNPLVWNEWLKFKSPNGRIASGEVDPPAFIGPRGGTYTMDVTADGRPCRRYF